MSHRRDLAPMDRTVRLARLREELATQSLDALWVTRPVDVRWLVGFTGSNGRVLVAADAATLFTDGRYEEQSERELTDAGLLDHLDVHIGVTDVGDSVNALLGDRSVGFEADVLTVAAHQDMVDWFASPNLVPTEGIIATLRQVKDPGERQRLEHAAGIADDALASMLDRLVPGVTERAFSLDLDRSMLDLGADALSFETIVAGGPNSALPHAQPSDRPFSDGDLVVIDFGASVDGYGSDMTRTFCVGEPTQRHNDLYDAVAAAQQAGVAAVRDGVEEREIDTVCRTLLTEAGLGEAFIHGTGHGIGLEIHEQPILSSRSVGILRAGLIITVEPGAYLRGFGGVRVEDSVVVTAAGAEPITHAPKGLVPTSGEA